MGSGYSGGSSAQLWCVDEEISVCVVAMHAVTRVYTHSHTHIIHKLHVTLVEWYRLREEEL